jgi:hypothetical protein
VAIQEFSQGQERPDLKLILQPGDSDSVTLERTGSGHWEFRISVLNTGPAVGVWYQAEIRVPFELAPWSQQPLIDTQVFLVMGTRAENCRTIPGDKQTPHLLAFLSGGGYAAFTGWPLILCAFRVGGNSQPINPGAYKIEYSIITDRGPLRRGTLTVTVVE